MVSKRPPHALRGDIPPPVCAECDRLAIIASGKAIFPLRPEMHSKVFYACSCGARVGCHPGTAVPLGTPANARTRYLRHQAHLAFDPFWKPTDGRRPGRRARFKAYKWLAGELGIKTVDCHIGWFNAEWCQRVIQICANAERRVA